MSVILGHIHRKQSGDLISSLMNKENNHYIIKVYEQIVRNKLYINDPLNDYSFS